MHLVLEVEADKAVDNHVERLADDLKETLRTEKVPFIKVEYARGSKIAAQLASPEDQTEFAKVVEKIFPFLKIAGAEMLAEGVTVNLILQDTEAQRVRKMAESQALETIRNRIDQFGVTEPDIRLEEKIGSWFSCRAFRTRSAPLR